MSIKNHDQYIARKRKIRKIYLLFMWLGYCGVVLLSIGAHYYNIAPIPYYIVASTFIFITLVIVINLIFIIIIRNPGLLFNRLFSLNLLISFFIVYGIFLFYLEKNRIIGLLFVLGPVYYQASYFTFKESLFYSLGVSALYLFITIFGIKIFHQEGFLAREFIYTSCFLLTAMYISMLSKKFNQQQKDLKKNKQKIEEIKDQIWSEMELAKKIQQILLPVNPSIHGYEIMAHTIPAVEIGGDYYDIINTYDKNWIVIGDVSGHGVSAGLIMMMVQTAIHTAVKQYTNITPSELLVIINKIISFNIKQFNEDKYMTITVLATHQDGILSFSGLHQDILIYRADKKSIECISTNGMWIGLLDDINNMLHDKQVTLNKGDILLLYTDGITEAWKKNRKNNINYSMYGSENLKKHFLQLAEAKSNEIINKILESLAEYSLHDDVTLMVIKKL